MNTPIVDFVKKYADSDTIRAHMPGHKGKVFFGFEHLDITEIKGADALFECDSIIKESEENASAIFNSHTYYSTEGSSLCIRAMLYLCLLYAKAKGKNPLILSARNVHKTFVSAVALTGLDVEWFYGDDDSYLSCKICTDTLDRKLTEMAKKPVAFYLTSPDYLGNIADIKAISKVCKKHDVLLLTDNAHGAYLKFLDASLHPVDLGADMCCDSAHKTLPVITGGAYLHINHGCDKLLTENAKKALSLFASTSPSYLILQSLDKCNEYLRSDFKEKLTAFAEKIKDLKTQLKAHSYQLFGNEALKITINTKSYGYEGTDFAEILRENRIECEFSDPDFVVLMLTQEMSDDDITHITKVLLSIDKKAPILTTPPKLQKAQKVMNIRDAVLSISENVDVKDSIGKTLCDMTLSCPPAVPILVSGEKIDKTAIDTFSYYGIEKCNIVI